MLTTLLTWLLYFAAALLVTAVVISSDILSYFAWYRNLRKRTTMGSILMSTATAMIRRMNEQSSSNQQLIDFDRDNKRMTIVIPNGQTVRSIVLPFLPVLSSKMNIRNIEVYLVESNGQQTLITHPPGVPYPYTAFELGGIGYVVTRHDQVILTTNSSTRLSLQELEVMRRADVMSPTDADQDDLYFDSDDEIEIDIETLE